MFHKVLVANRGEIAVRIVRACREMGIQTVAVYTKAEAKSRHVEMADQAICVGEGADADGYLNLANVLMAAQISGADAVHPGCGLFSERASFVEALASLGVQVVGPSAETIKNTQDRARAKQMAQKVGVAVVPGSSGAVLNESDAIREADALGYPVMLKALAGDGRRQAGSREELLRLWPAAQAEGAAVFVEKAIADSRRVDYQVLADAHGNVVHLGERECCDLGPANHKLIEESPCAAIGPELRDEMGAAAVKVAKALGFANVGTVSFLLDRDGRFFFLESKAGLQIGHAVTEEVSDVDIVKAQIRLAAGEPVPFEQADVRLRGHAIGARICANDPERQFAPCCGVVSSWRPPAGRGVRLDTHVSAGYEITRHSDPLIAKLVVRGADREEAVRKLQVALDTFVIEGVATNLAYLRQMVARPEFIEGRSGETPIPSVVGEHVG